MPILIAVAAVIIIPPVLMRMHDIRLRTRCAANLKAVGTAAKQYWASVGGVDDPLAALVVVGALAEDEIFDPRSGKAFQIVELPRADRSIDVDQPILISGPSCSPLDRWLGKDVSDCADGGGILYADGHSEFHPIDEYCRILDKYGMPCGD